MLRDLERACPLRIRTILADNGKEFTDRLFGLRKRSPTGKHDFDQLCAELGIDHRLAPPQHPQTNGIPLGDCLQSPAGQRVDAGEQRARDSDARQILNAELKKAEARQIELQREYNKGEPERRGDETRNYQKYLDRVAEIKASLARNESDMASIRRELARQTGGPAASAGK